MRPYGLKVIEWPDAEDLTEMGAHSSACSAVGKSGDFHGYRRMCKRRTRRYWKRLARRDGRDEIERQMEPK